MVCALAVASQGPKYKFGVEVPRSVPHAMYLDKVNGNTLWYDAIQKELNQLNEYKTFRTLNSLDEVPPDYQRLRYHIVFDVKYDLR